MSQAAKGHQMVPFTTFQNMTPLLSILIPGVPSRISQAQRLVNKLTVDSRFHEKGKIEILWLVDNWSMTLGEKRNRLIEMARGEYFSFVDDDDFVSEDYVDSLLEGMLYKPDVVTFQQDCDWNGLRGIINFRLGAENGEFLGNGQVDRAAWHVCAWRKDVAGGILFDSVNWGEDQEWANKANQLANTEHHLNKVLHIYQHIPNLSESLARHRGQR